MQYLADTQNDLIFQLMIPWARLGQVPAQLLERCAQETLWGWLEAQVACFDSAREAQDGMGLLDDISLDTTNTLLYSSSWI